MGNEGEVKRKGNENWEGRGVKIIENKFNQGMRLKKKKRKGREEVRGEERKGKEKGAERNL